MLRFGSVISWRKALSSFEFSGNTAEAKASIKGHSNLTLPSLLCQFLSDLVKKVSGKLRIGSDYYEHRKYDYTGQILDILNLPCHNAPSLSLLKHQRFRCAGEAPQ